MGRARGLMAMEWLGLVWLRVHTSRIKKKALGHQPRRKVETLAAVGVVLVVSLACNRPTPAPASSPVPTSLASVAPTRVTSVATMIIPIRHPAADASPAPSVTTAPPAASPAVPNGTSEGSPPVVLDGPAPFAVLPIIHARPAEALPKFYWVRYSYGADSDRVEGSAHQPLPPSTNPNLTPPVPLVPNGTARQDGEGPGHAWIFDWYDASTDTFYRLTLAAGERRAAQIDAANANLLDRSFALRLAMVGLHPITTLGLGDQPTFPHVPDPTAEPPDLASLTRPSAGAVLVPPEGTFPPFSDLVLADARSPALSPDAARTDQSYSLVYRDPKEVAWAPPAAVLEGFRGLTLDSLARPSNRSYYARGGFQTIQPPLGGTMDARFDVVDFDDTSYGLGGQWYVTWADSATDMVYRLYLRSRIQDRYEFLSFSGEDQALHHLALVQQLVPLTPQDLTGPAVPVPGVPSR